MHSDQCALGTGRVQYKVHIGRVQSRHSRYTKNVDNFGHSLCKPCLIGQHQVTLKLVQLQTMLRAQTFDS